MEINKKYVATFIATLLMGVAFGIVCEKFLSNYIQEQLQRIFSKSEPELVGYQGTAKIEGLNLSDLPQ